MSDLWAALRASTQARIGLGRAGDALPTADVLALREAHALARDAVYEPLDALALAAAVDGVVVASRAADRAEYLRRPDLGRLPADLSVIERSGADVGVVLADGLSSLAVARHGLAVYRTVRAALPAHLTMAPLVVATQARVALGDHIGAAMGVATVIVLIGERPGLSAADSLGAYLTHHPQPGRTDAERNCVSNIRPPDGLGYEAAAGVLAALVIGARQLGRSGVALKGGAAAGSPSSGLAP